ncbi:MAG: NYN domain-containing protein [Thermomicrobiales bacterium]|nr:NYN domain-containing protein [Thermomicrobiales bacterium]MCO5221366.1 NYN domain-containing protein [Thermomicrobiales bacterium]
METIPNVDVIRGSLRQVEKCGIQRSNPAQGVVLFDTFEEKGSDVNLGVRLVWDAARGAFDEAIVMSNDSDLAEAIRIVTNEIGKPVLLYSPDVTVNNALRPPISTDARPLNTKLFKSCLLPDPIVTPAGVIISRPQRWS